MKRRAALGTLAGATLLAGCAPFMRGAEKPAYLFAYFTGNGADGLHLAASHDGYEWEALGGGASFLTPTVGTRLMRDPSLARGPDGLFHMVWTSGWNDRGIGYASSPDLLTWSPQRDIPVMGHEPTARNAWAPEIFYDAGQARYLILWSSTIPGRFPETAGKSEDNYNHRIYATTTRDFVSFTPTRLYYDPGFSVIDATLAHAFGKDWLLVKDETRHPAMKHLRVAQAAGFEGPFGALGAPITPSGLWSEGPTVLQVGDEVIMYYDAYTAGHYGALRTRDMVNWEDVTAKLRFPGAGTRQRVRHGTAFAVPAALLERIRQAKP